MKDILRLIKKYKYRLFVILFFSFLASSLSVMFPKFISETIDTFQKSQFSLTNSLTILVGILIASVIFSLIQNILSALLSEKISLDLRTEIVSKIGTFGYLDVNKITPSRLITTVTSDVDAVKNALIQAFVGVFVSLVTIIGGATLLISISPKIGIIVLGILFFLSFSFNFLFRNARKYFTKSQENIDNLNRVINENILSSFLIRVLNTQDIEEGKFDIANTNAMVLGKKIVGIFSVVLPLITFLASLCTVVVVYIGGSDLFDGTLTVGNLNALISYVSLLIFPVLSLSFIVNNLTRALSSIKRIREVLDIVESKSVGTIKEGFVADIEFKDVSLELDKQPILKGINISIKKGQRVAIIGPTGAGKSQLFNLLSGLNVPTGGNILVNGVDIKEYDRDYIYTNIGLVFQENIIFNTTIKENITFGEEYEFSDLEKAVNTAKVNDFLELMDDGMKTVISERGSDLSGGQKQRLSLARALVRNPKLLLLDDFTARVDMATEKEILDLLEKNYPDITVCLITQKLSTAKHYDIIYLVMNGELVDSGKHEELLERCFEYRQIYESQNLHI